MEQEWKMTINQLPSPTWNWLCMNESSLEHIKTENWGMSMETEIPWGIQCDWLQSAAEEQGGVLGGMGRDMDGLAAAGGRILRITAKEGHVEEQPVLLHAVCRDGANGIQKVEIHAEENSCVTVIMDAVSGQQDSGMAAIQTQLFMGKKASIRLVQLQMLGEGFLHLCDVGAVCQEGGRARVLQLQLGGSRVYSGLLAQLDGTDSCMEAKVGYLGRKKQRLDMNHVAKHMGARSQSRILASGVLRDQAWKLFRGTIDFAPGASDSEGEEREEVLLLGEEIVNQTIPLILCGEENVRGSHGASIGRLDEEMLFYLESRGIGAAQAEDMMVRARLDALCGEIPREESRNLVQNYVKGVISHGKE